MKPPWFFCFGWWSPSCAIDVALDWMHAPQKWQQWAGRRHNLALDARDRRQHPEDYVCHCGSPEGDFYCGATEAVCSPCKYAAHETCECSLVTDEDFASGAVVSGDLHP